MMLYFRRRFIFFFFSAAVRSVCVARRHATPRRFSAISLRRRLRCDVAVMLRRLRRYMRLSLLPPLICRYYADGDVYAMR